MDPGDWDRTKSGVLKCSNSMMVNKCGVMVGSVHAAEFGDAVAKVIWFSLLLERQLLNINQTLTEVLMT